MGKGIVAHRNLGFAETWSYRLERLGQTCPELAQDVATLTSGGALEHSDGSLELAWDARDGGTLSLRRPGEPRVVDLTIMALDPSQVADPDPRSARPCPSQWRSGRRDRIWELFNCRITTFLSRRDTPS